MYSILNSSTIPLQKNGIFLGKYEDLTGYESITVSINTSSNCEIIAYFSPDKNISVKQYFLVYPNDPITFVINPIVYKYFYLTCRNQDNTNQSFLLLQTCYNASSISSVSTPSGTIADIPQLGSKEVFNGSTGANGYSSNVKIALLSKNITIYGHVSDSTTLTVCLSNDDINYFDSQYSVILSGSTDFGFSLPSTCAVKYLKVKSLDDVNCVCYVNYC
jgi:hypothetical protein